MPLTVLTDSNVKEILDNLTKDETEVFQKAMRDCLHEYATASTASASAAENQPNRTVIESPNGNTTLFMPSTNSNSIGMKGAQYVPDLADLANIYSGYSPWPFQYLFERYPSPRDREDDPSRRSHSHGSQRQTLWLCKC